MSPGVSRNRPGPPAALSCFITLTKPGLPRLSAAMENFTGSAGRRQTARTPTGRPHNHDYAVLMESLLSLHAFREQSSSSIRGR